MDLRFAWVGLCVWGSGGFGFMACFLVDEVLRGVGLEISVCGDRLVGIEVLRRGEGDLGTGMAGDSDWSLWILAGMSGVADWDDSRLDWGAVPVLYRRILEELRQTVPAGQRISYGELAERCGIPRGARVVGAAMAANPFPILFPCHRVVLKSGKIGAYSGGGPEVKRYLLEVESTPSAASI